MTEEEILAGNFIFISYSHKDQDAVREDVEKLHARGVRVWFDVEMRLSDKWQTVAQEKIRHPNCKGVLFYNSKDAFLSDAIAKERALVQERKQADPDFGYWSINIDGKTIAEIYSTAMGAAPEKIPVIMEKIWPTFNALFPSNDSESILYIKRDGSQDWIERIYQEIALVKMLVDDVGLVEKEAEKENIRSRDTGCFTFGKYIDKRCYTPHPHNNPTERFTANGEEYISIDNQIYTLRPLRWNILYTKDDISVYLCTDIVDSCRGDALEDYLKTFKALAFADKQDFLNADPRLLTQSDVEKMPPEKASALALSSPTSSRKHWWIAEKGLLENWKKTYYNNREHKNGFVASVEKGVRPVVEISNKHLSKLKEN